MTRAASLADMNTPVREINSGWNALKWWALSFAAANIASALVVTVTGHAGDATPDIPIWVTLAGALVLWAVELQVFPRRVAPELLQPSEIKSWFSPTDVLKFIPLGIAGQLILVNIVNWPLSKIWPHTFSFDEVSQRANEVTNSAPGAWVAVLIVVVVLGAPVVEEILYRGTLQPALKTLMGSSGALVFTAALFATIHFQAVEWPGLFAFALLLGVVRERTGRLGPTVLTHLAFNATGLLLVSLT